MDSLPDALEKYVNEALEGYRYSIVPKERPRHWMVRSEHSDAMRAAILAFLNAAEKDGWAMVQTKGNAVLPEQAFGFLMGTDSLAGRWFGDDHVGRPKYWWRTEIRAMIDAAKEERS